MSEALVTPGTRVVEQEELPRYLFDWLRQPMDARADMPLVPDATFERMRALPFTANQPLEVVMEDIRAVVATMPEMDAMRMYLYFAGFTDEQLSAMAPDARSMTLDSWEKLELGLVARMFLRGTLGNGRYSPDDSLTPSRSLGSVREESGRRGALRLIRDAEVRATFDDVSASDLAKMLKPEAGDMQEPPPSASTKERSRSRRTKVVRRPAHQVGASGLRIAVIGQPQVAQGRSEEPGSGVDWRLRAACRPGAPSAPDPEVFSSNSRVAKKICNLCPVRAECLAYAITHDERYGVWGGMTETERAQLKRRVGQSVIL